MKEKIVDLFKWGWFKFMKCILGTFLYSLAVNLFIVPNKLYTGGILGTSQLLRSLILHFVDLSSLPFDISSVIYYLLNIPLLILAYKAVGKTFFVRTIFTVTLNSLFLALIPIPSSPLVSELITNVLIGGIIAGVGVGFVLSTGSSSGGTDIIGVYLSKKSRNVTVGYIGLIYNTIVFSICGIFYGIQTMIYSVIYAVFESIMVDKNHSTNIFSELFIFTKADPNLILDFIKNTLNRDATYWKAKGAYTNTNTNIIYCVLSKYERMRLERHMNELDSKAFIVKNDGVAIKGEFEKNFLYK